LALGPLIDVRREIGDIKNGRLKDDNFLEGCLIETELPRLSLQIQNVI